MNDIKNINIDDLPDNFFDELLDDTLKIDIPYDLIAKIEAEEAERERIKSMTKSSQQINNENIQNAINKWRRDENDVGSPEVQIVIANEKIKYLTKHLLINKKDFASRRGLNAIVNLRRKQLNYLYKHNKEKALQMVNELGIRFKPPGMVWDKASKYAHFKNTKSKEHRLRIANKLQNSESSS